MVTKIKSPTAEFTHYLYPPADFDDLFELGENGLAYNFTVANGLYQDTSATTPVTKSDQALAYSTDQSGNANYLLGTTASARLLWYLDTENNVYSAMGDGNNDRNNTLPTTILAETSAITILLAAWVGGTGNITGPILRIQSLADTTYEAYIDIKASGVSVRRITGEEVVTSDAIATGGERFVLAVMVDYEAGTLTIEKNGVAFQTLDLTSAGTTDLTSTTVSFMGNRGSTKFCRGGIYEVAIVSGKIVSNTPRQDYVAKLAQDSAIAI